MKILKLNQNTKNSSHSFLKTKKIKIVKKEKILIFAEAAKYFFKKKQKTIEKFIFL